MMTEAQIRYELDYWLHTDRAKNDARQRKILELWGFTGAKRVVEIGTGPWGGCLSFIEAEVKIGVDPMYGEYRQAKLMPAIPTWHTAPFPIEEVTPGVTFDAALCMNTLDHGDSNFSAIDAIARLLVAGGHFYLHVNLRTPGQLNEGHDHSLKLADLEEAIKRNSLKKVRCTLYDYDPVEWAPYPTLVGVWERAA